MLLNWILYLAGAAKSSEIAGLPAYVDGVVLSKGGHVTLQGANLK